MTMTVRELLVGLGESDAPATVITGLAIDSRRVVAGDLFVAYRGGAHDGHDFASQAAASGAAAVLSERPVKVNVPNVVLPDVGRRLGHLARRFHFAETAVGAHLGVDIVGVTGTNGKTSVAWNVARVLGGGYLGTLGWGAPPERCPGTLTTADPITLFARLRNLRDRGLRMVAAEVSSHALDQGRVDAMDVAIGVFTNLTRDHLDYHGTLANYAAAKRKLFDRALPKGAVVNADDRVGRDILAALPALVDRVSFGRRGDVRWDDVVHGRCGMSGRWLTPWGDARFHLRGHFGDFSLYNGAAVVAVCCLLGAPLGDVIAAMGGLDAVPGRMQVVAESPRVVIDYAHTPDALTAALGAARLQTTPPGRLIVVFGCGGDRDRGKRTLMAQAAESGADVVIVTSDNPRGESPARIVGDVMAGLDSPAMAHSVVDRAEAIARALDIAEPSDVLLIAGKGHETGQEVAGERLPFSDTDVVQGCLAHSAEDRLSPLAAQPAGSVPTIKDMS